MTDLFYMNDALRKQTAGRNGISSIPAGLIYLTAHYSALYSFIIGGI